MAAASSSSQRRSETVTNPTASPPSSPPRSTSNQHWMCNGTTSQRSSSGTDDYSLRREIATFAFGELGDPLVQHDDESPWHWQPSSSSRSHARSGLISASPPVVRHTVDMLKHDFQRANEDADRLLLRSWSSLTESERLRHELLQQAGLVALAQESSQNLEEKSHDGDCFSHPEVIYRPAKVAEAPARSPGITSLNQPRSPVSVEKPKSPVDSIGEEESTAEGSGPRSVKSPTEENLTPRIPDDVYSVSLKDAQDRLGRLLTQLQQTKEPTTSQSSGMTQPHFLNSSNLQQLHQTDVPAISQPQDLNSSNMHPWHDQQDSGLWLDTTLKHNPLDEVITTWERLPVVNAPNGTHHVGHNENKASSKLQHVHFNDSPPSFQDTMMEETFHSNSYEGIQPLTQVQEPQRRARSTLPGGQDEILCRSSPSFQDLFPSFHEEGCGSSRPYRDSVPPDEGLDGPSLTERYRPRVSQSLDTRPSKANAQRNPSSQFLQGFENQSQGPQQSSGSMANRPLSSPKVRPRPGNCERMEQLSRPRSHSPRADTPPVRALTARTTSPRTQSPRSLRPPTQALTPRRSSDASPFTSGSSTRLVDRIVRVGGGHLILDHAWSQNGQVFGQGRDGAVYRLSRGRPDEVAVSKRVLWSQALRLTNAPDGAES